MAWLDAVSADIFDLIGWHPEDEENSGYGNYYELEDSEDSGDNSADDSDEEPEPEVGKLVERFDFQKGVCDGSGNDLDTTLETSLDEDMWTSMPDEVMRSIVDRLPFSAFCCFRSVCKKWNSLVVYPDASQMATKNSRDAPLCVLCTGINQFMCYNPYLHFWYRLPATFGTSFGALGFSYDECRVVAGTSGLLVLQSPDMGLWVVNPINKCERRLPNVGVCGSIVKVHIHFIALTASYRVLAVWELLLPTGQPRKSGKFELHVFDSLSDSWDRYVDDNIQGFYNLTSVVEYDGALCCLLSHDSSTIYNLNLDFDPPGPPDRETNANIKVCEVNQEVPELPIDFTTGQLFIHKNKLMLGGIKSTDLRSVGLQEFACIWELSRSNTKWLEIAHVPIDTFHLPRSFFKPVVTIRNKYMWITEWNTSDVKVGGIGVMCHIPSNSWWKLPKNSGSTQLRLQRQVQPGRAAKKRRPTKSKLVAQTRTDFERNDDFSGTCLPFLFEPRMGLVP